LSGTVAAHTCVACNLQASFATNTAIVVPATTDLKIVSC